MRFLAAVKTLYKRRRVTASQVVCAYSGTKLCQPAQHKESCLMVSPCLSFRIATAVPGHVHGCFQGCTKKNRGLIILCVALMTALALLPCLRPETSSWAGSGCTGRHDGPATARSKGAVPGSTGASNSKLSATNCLSATNARYRDANEPSTSRCGPRRGEATTNAVRACRGRPLRRRRGALRLHRVAVAGPRRAARRRDGVRLFNRRAPARDQIRNQCTGRRDGRRHRAARPGL